MSTHSFVTVLSSFLHATIFSDTFPIFSMYAILMGEIPFTKCRSNVWDHSLLSLLLSLMLKDSDSRALLSKPLIKPRKFCHHERVYFPLSFGISNQVPFEVMCTDILLLSRYVAVSQQTALFFTMKIYT